MGDLPGINNGFTQLKEMLLWCQGLHTIHALSGTRGTKSLEYKVCAREHADDAIVAHLYKNIFLGPKKR
jgi:hypothetical protein